MKSKKILVLFIVFLLIGSTMLVGVQHGGVSTRISIHSAASSPEQSARPGGPLKVHPSNPRYFTDGSGKAIFLAGFEYWDALVEGGYDPAPDFINFSDFLNAIEPYGSNFIRLWMYYEATKYKEVWQRTGPGYALDRRPKFDLTKFNQGYFDELRTRVVQARDRGYYVSVMFFEGTSGHLDEEWWSNHPFNGNNNINGVNAGVPRKVHTLTVSSVTNVQKEYVKKVIDTLNDLDNVLYEISNEDHTHSIEWQIYMINFVKSYGATKPKQHPVGMSAIYEWGVVSGDYNYVLFGSPVHWIAPGISPSQDYVNNPPAADGSKVVIADTDHIQPQPVNGKDWAWKSFTRGLNLLAYLELYEIKDPDTAKFPVRKAIGHILTYANKMNLAAMTPRGDLTSTSYALANPSSEYLIYLPSSGHPGIRWLDRLGLHPWVNWLTYLIGWNQTVKVDVSGSSETFRVEWFNPRTGETVDGATTSGGGKRSFTCPFTGDALIHIYKA